MKSITFNQLKRLVSESFRDWTEEELDTDRLAKEASRRGEYYAIGYFKENNGTTRNFLYADKDIDEVDATAFEAYDKYMFDYVLVYGPDNRIQIAYNDYSDKKHVESKKCKSKNVIEEAESSFFDDERIDKQTQKIVDEYRHLEDEIKKIVQQYSGGIIQKTSGQWKAKERLQKLGVYPGGISTEDGLTGEEYFLYPDTVEKYKNDEAFRNKVKKAKKEYQDILQSNWQNYISALEPIIKKLMDLHNTYFNELRNTIDPFYRRYFKKIKSLVDAFIKFGIIQYKSDLNGIVLDGKKLKFSDDPFGFNKYKEEWELPA